MPTRVQMPNGQIAEFPDGMSADEITSVLDKENSAGAGADEGMLTKVGRFAKDNAPMLGGAALGLATGGAGLVPAIGLAALGGAGGKGYQIAADALGGKVSPSMGDDVKEMATSGAIQGVTEGLGRGVGAGLKAGGNAVYRGLLKPSKLLRENFGGGKAIADTAIREGALVTEGGAAKMAGKVSAARQAAMDTLDDAASSASNIKPREIISEFAKAGPGRKSTIQQLRGRADLGMGDDMAAVGQRGAKLVKTLHPLNGGVGLKRAQELKELAQEAAYGGQKGVASGAKEMLSADDMLNADVARGLKGAIESRVPAMAGKNATTQQLLGALRALSERTGQQGNNLAVGGARDLIAAGVGGGAYATGNADGNQALVLAAIMRALASPRGGSMAAIAMDRLGSKPVAQTAARGLSSLMSSHEDD